MSNPRKIPKQLFVTFKEELRYDMAQDANGNWYRTGVTDREVIGFMNEYSAGKAGDKRKATQMKWAYPVILTEQEFTNMNPERYWEAWCFENGMKFYRDYYDRNNPPIIAPIPPDTLPAVWDNDPVAGIKVCGFKSRYSTSNKLILVEDPRGGKFEVKVESFVDLMSEVTVINGVIQDKCIWTGNKTLEKF